MLKIDLPTNEVEFSAMMECVDLFLRETNVPVYARPIKACFEISKTLNLGLNIVPREKIEPKEGVYTDNDLTLRIYKWFDDRYEKKLAKNMGPGRIVLLVRGDPWEVLLPKVWGTVKFFASVNEKSSSQEEDLRLFRVPRYNILDAITDFPSGFASSLNAQELSEITHTFLNALESMVALEEISKNRLVREIQSDIDAAVNHILLVPPHYGTGLRNGGLFRPLKRPSRHIY